MNIVDEVLGAQNGQGLTNLAQQFGLTEDQTRLAANTLVPRLVSGLKSNGGGADSIMGLMTQGNFSHFFHAPAGNADPAATDQGNGALGKIFGSKDVSSAVAEQSAKQTGIDSGILKKMLPVLATLVLGALASRLSAPGTAGASAGGAGASGLGSVLGGLLGGTGGGAQTTLGQGAEGILDTILNANHSGGLGDDLARMAGKMFGH